LPATSARELGIQPDSVPLNTQGYLYRGAPRAPTRIYAASADDQVAFTNAEHCVADLRTHGVVAPLHAVGKLDHFGSTVAATPQVLAWFDRLDP
jgi:hypothetical protein